MKFNDILTELENYALEVEELKGSAGALQASVTYFFEQLASRETWSLEALLEVKEKCQINKSLDMLEAAFQTTEEEESE
ncbi:hypothetical protein [Spirosoma sp.]|uniref:hypothetical protein n=1 Tax=Spirosoma sp. TaxID=1899569 RepID=UPI00260B8B34|nr:hypothetical protein [Spirosoma sp.]MCX6216550.1 hypothetical protein [Spirosoma sp.]